MAKYGLLINYDYCTGCHSCEVACQQEHDFPAGKNGIMVTEYLYETFHLIKYVLIMFHFQRIYAIYV
jgi:Fe-S-cluster-containing dehydrogenase component